MYKKMLLLIYQVAVRDGKNRVPWMERFVDYDESYEVSDDDIINVREAYIYLFDKCRLNVERLYATLLGELKKNPYDRSGDIMDALIFLQEMAATALWKYRQDIGERLESFVREFDRLDVEFERVRLYELAMTLE